MFQFLQKLFYKDSSSGASKKKSKKKSIRRSRKKVRRHQIVSSKETKYTTSNNSKKKKRNSNNQQVKDKNENVNTTKVNQNENVETTEEELKEIPPSIKNNPWNIHYVANNEHAHIVLKSKNKEALTLGTTTEEKDPNAKFKLQDGLERNQKQTSFVKKKLNVFPTKLIQRQKKDSSITKQDKDLIYENIKSYGDNPRKYQLLGELIPEEEKQKNVKKRTD